MNVTFDAPYDDLTLLNVTPLEGVTILLQEEDRLILHLEDYSSLGEISVIFYEEGILEYSVRVSLEEVYEG